MKGWDDVSGEAGWPCGSGIPLCEGDDMTKFEQQFNEPPADVPNYALFYLRTRFADQPKSHLVKAILGKIGIYQIKIGITKRQSHTVNLKISCNKQTYLK